MPEKQVQLPPGQHVRSDFPRFGLGKFADRFPAMPERVRFSVGGDVAQVQGVTGLDAAWPRQEQCADFHCVTTWSVLGVRWGGVRFRDFHTLFVLPQVRPASDAVHVVFRGEDSYCTMLPLEDLLADDVLLADTLDGAPLGIAHGAPLRLVAPAHYGFKNVKHVVAIEYWRDRRNYRFPRPYPSFMDHPRGRVALEERARYFPPALIRFFYRLLVPSAVWRFRRALRRHQQRTLDRS